MIIISKEETIDDRPFLKHLALLSSKLSIPYKNIGNSILNFSEPMEPAAVKVSMFRNIFIINQINEALICIFDSCGNF